MTLRARLIFAFVALAVIPIAIFTVFTFDQLNRSIGRWYRPGVDLALESAVEVTKSSVARTEGTVRMQAEGFAQRWQPGLVAPARVDALRRSLRAAGLDFLQVYEPSGDGWVRTTHVTAEGLIEADPPDLAGELSQALAEERLVRSRTGVIAGAARSPRGEAIVAGIRVSPDFYAQVDRVTNGMTYYRQLGIAVNVWRPFVWVLVGAVTVLLVVLAVFVARRLAADMSRPLHDLAGAIGRVSGGDLATRVTPQGALELRSLGSSFNTMTERLEAARAAVQQAEREAVWRDVAQKLAHEIKNMLTPIQLSMQLLERQSDSIPEPARERVAKSLEVALSELGHLTHLAEQFSQYARLPEPRFERLDLGDVARSVVTLTGGSSTRVECVTTESVEVRGDRLLLTRAIHNLVINACEASPAGGTVEVRASSRDGVAQIEVLDRGLGLPPEIQSRVFEPYVSTRKRGSGLGLSLARDIARQHNGEVTLENRPGGGARALFVLPVRAGVETRSETPSEIHS